MKKGMKRHPSWTNEQYKNALQAYLFYDRAINKIREKYDPLVVAHGEEIGRKVVESASEEGKKVDQAWRGLLSSKSSMEDFKRAVKVYFYALDQAIDRTKANVTERTSDGERNSLDKQEGNAIMGE